MPDKQATHLGQNPPPFAQALPRCVPLGLVRQFVEPPGGRARRVQQVLR
jgi:hypothetical protein